MIGKLKRLLKRYWNGISRAWRRIQAVVAPRWRRFAKAARPYGKHGWLWLSSLGLLVAAQATLIWVPQVGIYMNAVALAGLCAIAIWKPVVRQLTISMAVIPVANMVTASLAPHSNLGRTVVLYATMLLLALVYRFMFTLDFPELSTRLLKHGYAFGLPLMVVIGQLFGVVAYLFLRHHYPYTGYSLPLIALAAVVFAFTEEALLRGLIQQRAEQVFHPIVAALTTTVLYVFLAFDHGVLATLPVAIMMGAGLSFVYYKKKNLLLTMTLNASAKLIYIGLVASFVLR